MERYQYGERKINYDHITGLPGMSYFFELAEAGRKKLLNNEQEVAILFFDLSGMKHFNEQYGFSEGDKLISSFSELLVKHFGADNCSHFQETILLHIKMQTALKKSWRLFLMTARV